jgi:hypothetical protein
MYREGAFPDICCYLQIGISGFSVDCPSLMDQSFDRDPGRHQGGLCLGSAHVTNLLGAPSSQSATLWLKPCWFERNRVSV